MEALLHQVDRITLHDDQNPNHWCSILAARLRGPAESNWKVRCVLVRHGWSSGRFRRTPDREQLLRDLARQARVSGASGRSSSSATAPTSGVAAVAATGVAQTLRRDTRAVSAASTVVELRGSSMVITATEPTQRGTGGGGSGGHPSQARGGSCQEVAVGAAGAGGSIGAMRRRRANSWCARRCGHRNTVSTRLGGGAAVSGLGQAPCSGIRRWGVSRSP